jgi:hypothetical protein
MDSRPKRLSFDQRPCILIFDRWGKKWPIFDRKDGVSTMMAANAPHPNNNHRVGTFQEKTVPAEARLAGWAWLVHRFGAQAPVRSSSVVSDQHVKASSREEGEWTIYDKRYWPGDGFGITSASRCAMKISICSSSSGSTMPCLRTASPPMFAVPQQEHTIGAPGFSTNS